MGTLRGRLGYAFQHWMIYATGGYAWSLGRFLQTPGAIDDQDKLLHLRRGWTVGAGTEVALAPMWTLRLEYLYISFGHAGVDFPSGATARSSYDVHAVRAGLNYKIGSAGSGPSAGHFVNASQTEFNNWEIHGQTTFIQQGYPAFRSPYLGENSFTPWAQTRSTWTAGVFIGLRLWEGGELYYNPELLQGFGLTTRPAPAAIRTAKRRSRIFRYPHYNTSRLFLRQTFGLGGEQETVESDTANGREEGRIEGHRSGREIRRPRCLRQQRLCQ